MTKILPDDFKVENPCEGCLTRKLYTGEDCMPSVECRQREKYKDQQSILSACVEVDLDAMANKWLIARGNIESFAIPFSQFIEHEIYADHIRKNHKSNLTIIPQEAKDGK